MAHIPSNNIWVQIEDYINHIWSADGFVPSNINPATHMKLYTLIYDHYFHDATTNSRDLHINGSNLYRHINKFLQRKVQNIYQNVKDLADEDALRSYEIYWHDRKVISKYINGIYSYFNRAWIRRQYDADRTDVFEINVLIQKILEQMFFEPLFPHIKQTCLNLIKTNRINQSIVDVQSTKNLLLLYLDTNFIQSRNEDWRYRSIDDFYQRCFEEEFLQEVRDFYHQQKTSSFEPSRIFEYLIEIAKYFDYEIHSAESYLPETKSTLGKLMDILEEMFIPEDIFNVILEKIQLLLWNENSHQELVNLYPAIICIPKIRNELTRFLDNYVYQMGSEALQRVSQQAINDPKIYIKAILDFHRIVSKFGQRSSNDDGCFATAVDKACGKLINNNAVTQAAGSNTKSPELLARYYDALLRKGYRAVTGTDVEGKLNEMMIVFDYIEDKDVFLKFYTKMLAKRLVGQLSASDDNEASMISKLKQTCGREYTSKLERMYQDIHMSQTLVMEYGRYCETHQLTDIVDFSVMVLTANAWPFSHPSNFVVPIELKPTLDSFTEFYTHRHHGRMLIWLHQYSKGELQICFASGKYILQVSTYQMVVLLLFNHELTWTVQQIQERTQMKSELLTEILCGLLRNKIFICAEMNEDCEEVRLKMTDTITLANDWKSEKRRVNLHVLSKLIGQKDMQSFDQSINEERRMIIQAAIVRIMKAKQTLKHALLMQEVIQQLSSRFTVNIPLIKKCIDMLIEKEYLERDPNEKDVLRYLA